MAMKLRICAQSVAGWRWQPSPNWRVHGASEIELSIALLQRIGVFSSVTSDATDT